LFNTSDATDIVLETAPLNINEALIVPSESWPRR
jgi:hypothetical protein